MPHTFAGCLCRLLVADEACDAMWMWVLKCYQLFKGEIVRDTLHFFWDILEHYSLRMSLLLRITFFQPVLTLTGVELIIRLYTSEVSHKIMLILLLVAPQWNINDFRHWLLGTQGKEHVKKSDEKSNHRQKKKAHILKK